MNKYSIIKTVNSLSELGTIKKEKGVFVCFGDEVIGGVFQYIPNNYHTNNGIDIIDGWTRIDSIGTLLTRLKDIDGSGSGLDADLLDGVEGYEYSKIADNENITGSKEFSNSVLSMPNLPTADPLVAGQLWNNAGTLTVSAG